MFVDKSQVLGLVVSRVKVLEDRLRSCSPGDAVSKWHTEGGIHELEELVLLINVLPVFPDSVDSDDSVLVQHFEDLHPGVVLKERVVESEFLGRPGGGV